MWSGYWRIAGVKRYSEDGSASKHHAWIREPRHCIRSACRQDVLTCDMLASCYASCWAATRYGVEHSHGVGRQTTSIRRWNVSTCLDGWIGYRVCCPVACLAVCRCTGAFLTDASLAWHGLGTLCEHDHLGRSSGSRSVTATDTAHVATTVTASGRDAIWHGRVYVNGFSTNVISLTKGANG